MKKLNRKDKALLKQEGFTLIWQWEKAREDWESITFHNFKSGQEVCVRK